jgi:hypothetical protein
MHYSRGGPQASLLVPTECPRREVPITLTMREHAERRDGALSSELFTRTRAWPSATGPKCCDALRHPSANSNRRRQLQPNMRATAAQDGAERHRRRLRLFERPRCKHNPLAKDRDYAGCWVWTSGKVSHLGPSHVRGSTKSAGRRNGAGRRTRFGSQRRKECAIWPIPIVSTNRYVSYRDVAEGARSLPGFAPF